MSESSVSYLTFQIQTLNEISFHDSQLLGKPETPQNGSNVPLKLTDLVMSCQNPVTLGFLTPNWKSILPKKSLQWVISHLPLIPH